MRPILGGGFGAQRQLDRSQELVVVEGLPEEGIRTGLDEALLLRHWIPGAHDDDGDAFERWHRLQTLHHEVAVPCREHEVEEDEVWVLLARLVDGRDRTPAKNGSYPRAFNLMPRSRRMSWSSSTMRILA